MERIQIDDQNYGVIDLPVSPTDWLAGSIPYVDRQVNWANFLPEDEPQSQGWDSFACVSFSALNVIEAQLNWWLTQNISDVHRNYLENVSLDGKVNFSDRFLAKTSGTTSKGNACTIVADAIRHTGLVPETMWPSDWDNWSDYYSVIPNNIMDEGRKFTELWNVEYEIIWNSNDQMNKETLKYHLKQAPLQICVRVCPNWSTGLVPKCDPYPTQHAVMLYGIDETTGEYLIFDHYVPYHKRLAADYNIPYVLKLVVTPKIPAPYINKTLKYFPQARDVVEAMREEFLGNRPWENEWVLDAHATKLALSWISGDHEGTRQFYRGWKPEIKQRVENNTF